MRITRKNQNIPTTYNIMVIDDEEGIIDAVKLLLKGNKYSVTGFTNPEKAIAELKANPYDLLILDYLLEDSTGQQVVERIRTFNREIYILLLTGHQDIAPPIETLNKLDIQAYCEKSDRFDQLLLMIESGIKSVNHIRTITKFHSGLNVILESIPKIFEIRSLENVAEEILQQLTKLSGNDNTLFYLKNNGPIENPNIIIGTGKFNKGNEDLQDFIDRNLKSFLPKIMEEMKIIELETGILFPITNIITQETGIIYVESLISKEHKKLMDIYIANAQSSFNNTLLHSIVNKKNVELQNTFVRLEEFISHKKKLEEELRQTQKMESLGKLAGSIAHDFNNILTVILGYTSILLSSREISENAYNKISKINEVGNRAAELIDQLLTFSRKQLISTTVVDLNIIINSFIKMLERLIGKSIDLKIELNESLWLIKADKIQIEQIILNIIINAKDAINDNGEIEIKTRNVKYEEIKKLNKPEIKAADYILLTISDTGTGIQPENLNQIFDPFFTTKDSGKGTGLGLSTVYGIVKQNEGYIYVESEPGKRTTFNIYFPKTEKKITKEKKADSKPINITGTEKILLVEDEIDVQDYIHYILENNGYTVYKSINGEDALEKYNDFKEDIDLLLTDIFMPKMNGRELVRKIQKLDPDIKILIMSGYLNNEITQYGHFYSKNNFIEKPFTPINLLEKVRTVLDS